MNDEDVTDPEIIKSYIIGQRDLLKKSNGGPIDDKVLGEEMLRPLLLTLSERTRSWAKEDPPRKVTLAFAKMEWAQHKRSWLEKFSNPAKQQRQRPRPAAAKAAGPKPPRPVPQTSAPSKAADRKQPPPPTCRAAAMGEVSVPGGASKTED